MSRTRRRYVLLGLVAVILLATACMGWALLGSTAEHRLDTSLVDPDDNLELFDSSVQGEALSYNPSVPFRIAGVDDSATVYEVADMVADRSVAAAWSFGGDFSQIGSLPLSPDAIFGSYSVTPDNLRSYRAGLLSRDGSQPLEKLSHDPYYEPRDATGDERRLVWYSSTLNEAYQMGINNWSLSVWESGDNVARVLGTAEDLNGSNDTPQLPGEVLPTANDDCAYFASYMSVDGRWVPVVLSYALDTSERAVIATGSYPYAANGGVYFAGDQIDSSDGSLGFSSVRHFDGANMSTKLTVDTGASQWCVSGVWMSDSLSVVSFSNAASDQGAFIGIWTGGFGSQLAWIHTPSPSVVGSISRDAFAWGCGSQQDHAEMYLYSAASPTDVTELGVAPGYSRPTLAYDGSAVLVPVYNGLDAAVRFDVIERAGES